MSLKPIEAGCLAIIINPPENEFTNGMACTVKELAEEFWVDYLKNSLNWRVFVHDINETMICRNSELLRIDGLDYDQQQKEQNILKQLEKVKNDEQKSIVHYSK